MGGRRRFVPTLTEVVNPAELVLDQIPPADNTVQLDVRLGVTTEQVLTLLGPQLEQRVAEAIIQAINEQMQGLQARVRRVVNDTVQDVVESAWRRSSKSEVKTVNLYAQRSGDVNISSKL